MKIQSQAKMRNETKAHADAAVEPVAFSASAAGAFAAEVSALKGGVGEIPLKLAIPFLKPRRALQTVAAIGSFEAYLNPFYVKVEGTTINLEGVLGTKGLRAKVDAKLGCKTDMEMAGRLAGKVGTFTVELEDEDLGLINPLD